MSARRIVFTKNNWKPEDKVALLSEPKFSYVIVGEEVGESGTPHLQGYAEFEKQMRFGPFAKKYSMYCQTARTQAEAIEYCKKGGNWEERGTPKDGPKNSGDAQKERWDTAKQLAKEGRIEEIPSDIYIRYYRTLKQIRTDCAPKLADLDQLENYWIWGPSGIGKSRKAKEMAEGHGYYPKQLNKWWDCYQGEPIVIIDDWEKDCHLDHHVKIWADHYEFIAETKGGSLRIRPEHIIVTSNYSPDECFTGVQLEAVRRRFRVIHMDKL